MNGGNRNLVVLFAVFLFLGSSLSALANDVNSTNDDYIQNNILTVDYPSAIAVSDSNPFYLLIATPIAVHYNELGEQTVIPLYVKNFENPSSSIIRTEQEQIQIIADFVISDIYSPKEASIIAATIWDESDGALILKDDEQGYNLGVTATPLASYLNIPVIVTDEIDLEIQNVLESLGVEFLYICGDLDGSGYESIYLENVDQIVDLTVTKINELFDKNIDYITLTNPLDSYSPEVLNKVNYYFTGEISSALSLPTQSVNGILSNTEGKHKFTVPEGYKYARISIDINNLNCENTQSLGDKLTFILASPAGPRYTFGGTAGGIPVRDSKGNILEDRLHYEVTVYDTYGEYTIIIYGQWFSNKKGKYDIQVTVEGIDTPIDPLMKQLSSIAPYITAYHQGIVLAKPDYAFAADDHVLFNGHTCPGVTQAGTNPDLLEPANKHTLDIHEELNNFLANLAEISVEDITELRNYYYDNPVYVTLVGDPTMVPMYFYQNPDGDPTDKAFMTGFGTASDFIYGDIDVNYSDPENNTETYWPEQENIVGRITGRDIQDCSALLARTIFYDIVLKNMENKDWKDNALVQTGCGLEFQNLPIITKLGDFFAGGGHGDPTKFPSGESEFINMRLENKMKDGYANTKGTFWLQSQVEGFSREDLDKIKKAGFLNKLLFPKDFIYFLNGNNKITGGKDQLNSNLIFTFAHGSYNLYEHGDVFIDSRGFPGVTSLSRIIPTMRSDLSTKGSYSVRTVGDMEFGPSVIFVESCITGRTDGLKPENTLSQAYIHAGVNTYIGASRFTADPGYLPPRPFKDGLGFGIIGLLKAIIDLKLRGQYPDAHFGAVIAEDFIIELIENDATVGLAYRNARNLYMEKDANTTFLWTPPLNFASGNSVVDEIVESFTKQTSLNKGQGSKDLGKKYVALHEFALYGDPAFNPYQSVNEGD